MSTQTPRICVGPPPETREGPSNRLVDHFDTFPLRAWSAAVVHLDGLR